MALDPNARCPASGLTNAMCQASICDCFPEEDDRFGIHPEYFIVDEASRFKETGELDPLPIHRTEAGWPNCSTCDGGGCPDCTDPA